MLKSMTGYGRFSSEVSGKKLTIEIRALNSRSFDLGLKVPVQLREHEPAIRNILSKRVLRGKIDFNLIVESLAQGENQLFNEGLFLKYYEELEKLARKVGNLRPEFLEAVLRLPNIIAAKEEDEQIKWDDINPVVTEAVSRLDEFRLREGKELEDDFKARIQNILQTLTYVEELEPGRADLRRKKIEEMFSDARVSEIDRNRLEQELIYYLEKLDITEEMLRLKTHCKYFVSVLFDSEIDKGKKLSFISQEIGREINTIGAKAYHAEIQKQVVTMKDELEKVKEQLLNVL